MASSNARPIRDELGALAAVLGETRRRLDELTGRLEDDEVDRWQKRHSDLESSYKEALNSAKWLRAQNIDLESRLENYKPELHNAIAARDDAFRRLKHARKVIRDLLTERADMSSPIARRLIQEDINEALGNESGPQYSHSSSSGSDKTVRVHAISSPAPSESSTFSSSHRPKASSPRASNSAPPRRANTEPKLAVTTSLKTQSNGVHSSPGAGPSRQSESIEQVISRAHSATSDSRNSSEELVMVHFNNPPGVSVTQEGPISWDRLQISLNLDDDTFVELRSLETSVDVSMRLAITHYNRKATVACLYDPILVDVPGRSYLLEWGRPKANQNQERYISASKARDAVFHTFLYPTSEKNWFYIGALEWTATQVPDYWPTFDGHSKKVVLRKLARRSGGELKEAEMAKMLDNGELQQFCIELTAISDPRIPHDFAIEVLGRQSSPYSPSRRERRIGGVKE